MNRGAEVDTVVIGAGAIGLACAAALGRRGASVVVIERHAGPGRETSSRNSGVIHAGLYYPPDSLKARLCVEGRERLYRWCRRYDVPHQKTGKLVVAAADGERAALESVRQRALSNGAGDVEWLGEAELARRDPALRGVAGLWSPESGVVDAHGLLDSLLAEARRYGVDVAWRSRVTALAPRQERWRVQAEGPSGEPNAVDAASIVNAAGLDADRVAALTGVDIDARGWRQHPCKGQYFALASSAPRPRTPLVYPVPGVAGLGIHLTVDLGGRCIAGPDATYVDEIDYRVDPSRAEAFAEAVARYLPGVRPEQLHPDYAGIRPKLQGPGEAFRDFVIAEDPPGALHLLGMESPGLTAALALGEQVAERSPIYANNH